MHSVIKFATVTPLLLFIIIVSHAADANKVTITFCNDIAEDASPHIIRHLFQVKERANVEIHFEKGIYHFYPDKAYEVYRHISNHDDVLTRNAFPLFGYKNICINGHGSTFIFHGVMLPFIIDNSSTVKIENISIDWHMPFHSEGNVVANNREQNTYDLAFTKDYPYEIRNEELIFLKEYYEHTVGQAYVYDPKIGGVAYNSQSYSTWWTIQKTTHQKSEHGIKYKYPFTYDKYDPNFSNVGHELASRFKQIEPGLVRVYNHSKELPPVGSVLVMKGAKGENRHSPAFHVTNSAYITIENVNVLHAGGMGLIAENTNAITLHRFNVKPSTGRMVSTTSDGLHFVGCRGSIRINNCQISNQLDDGINIHGVYQRITDILGPNQLGVRMGHFQQQAFKLGVEGDSIGVILPSGSIFPTYKLTVDSIELINSRYQIISTNEKLPENIRIGGILENLDAYPEVLIENCHFSKNRAHAILVSTPVKTIISNCYFNTDMGAIVAQAHADHWYESGNANNLFIMNNTFQDCGYGGGGSAVISFYANEKMNTAAFKNIHIVDNTFNHFDNFILNINGTEGLLFSGNTITNSETFKPFHPEQPAIQVNKSSSIMFKNNRYVGKADTILKTDKQLKDLKFH